VDGAYSVRMEGKVETPDGGQACLFAFDRFQVPDQYLVHDTDGGVTFGATQDVCLCLPASHGAALDQLWLRAEPTGPASLPKSPNLYSDNPYEVDVSLNPGQLQTVCDGGCTAAFTPSRCPGE
jgi:hypothetical protein